MDEPGQLNPPAGLVVGEPPLVPPVLPSQGEPPAAFGPTHGAGFWIRFLARFVDIVYGIVAGGILGFFLGVVFAILAQMGKLDSEWTERVGHNSVADFALGIIGAFLYHSIAEGIGGVSVGKLVCGLRVVRADGGRADLEAGLKRSLAYHWDAFFFGIVAYTRMERSPLRQRYGDAWGDTVVVKNSIFRSPAQPGGWRMLWAILLGTTLWFGLTTVAIVMKVA